jgi:translation initiation factor 1
MPKPRSVSDLSDLYKLTGGAAPEPRSEPSRDRAQALAHLHVFLEKKGRRGSGVTVIEGFHHTREDLAGMARELKNLCGAGGTVREDSIEIQGDHRATIAEWLRARGFRVKGVF